MIDNVFIETILQKGREAKEKFNQSFQLYFACNTNGNLHPRDAFQFLIQHEHRHINQATRVKRNDNFPKDSTCLPF